MKKEFRSENGEKLKSVKVNYEDGVITAEYEPIHKFKRGDIIAFKGELGMRIYIFDNYWGKNRCFVFCGVSSVGALYTKCLDSLWGYADYYTLATESEKQLLFDALRKEGKRWNDKTLEVEDIILVPESIGIYKLSDRATTSYDNGDGLYIGFNDSKQLLCYSNGVYGVNPFDSFGYDKIQCYLQPCKREDLKAGDTGLRSGGLSYEKSNSKSFLCNYRKILSNEASVFISDNQSIIVSELPSSFWYKIIPIK